MDEELRDTILEAIEQGLDAQLRAVRRLRKAPLSKEEPRTKKSMSQVDMAYAILKKARKPLHISVLLEQIERRFDIEVDRESLVSSLTKKMVRGDRFIRTDKNTFGLRENER